MYDIKVIYLQQEDILPSYSSSRRKQLYLQTSTTSSSGQAWYCKHPTNQKCNQHEIFNHSLPVSS